MSTLLVDKYLPNLNMFKVKSADQGDGCSLVDIRTTAVVRVHVQMFRAISLSHSLHILHCQCLSNIDGLRGGYGR